MRAAGEPLGSPVGYGETVTPLSWRDRFLAVRDSLLASPNFQRWASRFPPTRKIAKNRAKSLFDLCAGFVYSQVLLACVDLDLFSILAERPRTVDELSQRLSLSADAMLRLLKAASALQLVEKRSNSRFGLGTLGAALRGNPAVAAMVRHHAMLYADLHDPVALLRGRELPTALSAYWPYANADHAYALSSAQVAPYSALMASSQTLVAGDVLDAYPLDRHKRLLDVGGGEGAFLIEAAARAPGLDLALFDLPAVANRARDRIAAARLSDRATVGGGDFFADPLPSGADVVSLVRVLHDHDDAAVLALLRNIRRAMSGGAALLIAEPMSGSAETNTVGDAYFGFYLLAMGSGRVRTPVELQMLLQASGFGQVKTLRTCRPMLTGAVLARAV